jgi:hypothetical protein
MKTTKETVKVTLDRPGARACGKFQAGVEYNVDKKEAQRLVNVKGFRYVDQTTKTGES